MLHRVRNLLAVALVAALAPAATADTLSFTGTFVADNDVALFEFAVNGAAQVDLRTFSYSGGVNANGQVIAPGGFDSVLGLFDESGLLIGSFDDPSGPGDETVLALELTSGLYTVALTQYDNFAVGPNLSDGFLFDGDPTFTSAFGRPGGPTGPFLDALGNPRTGLYALDVTIAAVPEPASLALLAPGLLVVAARSRRRTPR